MTVADPYSHLNSFTACVIGTYSMLFLCTLHQFTSQRGEVSPH